MTNLVSSITQGASDSQRVGDHLYLQSILMRFAFSNGFGATANISTHYRVIVFQFFGDNNTLPLPSAFLLTSNMNAGNTYGTWSNLNVDYLQQYVILYDSMKGSHEPSKMYTVGSYSQAVTGTAGTPQGLCYWTITVPLSKADRNIRFYAGGAFGPNHVYVLITTDQASIATNPTVSYGSSVRFTDA